ncbi:hypothetical protein MYCTH_2309360 [Thermothelomyces thermophilus ATCC 42464]|uniref:Chitin synthase activator n=1 Tax=Thermothelomyces thermophilus (strain ATCC 42464 / BCRC 31852 / DSM 1799) TaxID=573729 RepID=G2QI73_THET4|nr:uncharacterized protein MYCTH_2309360 [Thermothelomyces thermophilus ATCC 42464]AEO60262.1 hypothetical protein MYCTH_2309360 [Thermothelomyces thermophilus ATCC 42464]
MAQFGATFIPGGQDDYYMPEVVAPAPQRVMPEIPQNVQDGIQRLELEARETEPNRDDKATDQTEEAESFKPFQTSAADPAAMDAPSFSPFPKVHGENIPPSDEEKETILWQARNHVLHSNNVSMQVTWARDVLIWVEIAQDAAAREWKREGKGKERPATPKTEHELRVDAINIIEYLAQQEHPEATFMKGKWLEFGKFGFRENKREAYTLYKKAAENGYGRAEYRMGMLYENSNDIPNAIKHYTLGVNLGDSASNYRLGMMHLMGQHGYQQDFLQGLQMIQQAADTADEDAPQGAYVYGMLIARELPDIAVPDHVLPCDLAVARQYIEKAAYLSFAKAQLKMGQAYELSQLGCDFNPAYSLHYYGLAARQNQPEASLGVSRWFLFGYEGIFPKNEQLAYKYALDAALGGLATGEFAMGYYHEIGIHVPKDIREARRWYEMAADHGNKDAKDRLESLNQSKTLTKADHETTTLTRIKSQHGSQRGKRPDRFTKPKDVLPTVTESDQNAGVQFPDPSPRPPAFTVNLDGNSPAARPKSSVAPYPTEDQPMPPNVRPRSTAPYPDDDVRGPHVNPNAHLPVGPGPHADREGSAFGIRPLSPNSGGLRPGSAGRGRPVSSQPVMGGRDPQAAAGYRKPSPGPGGQWQQPPPPQHDPRYGDPGHARLQKPNPNLQPTTQGGPPAGQYPMGGGQPGRDYGRPGPNNRPVSDNYGAAGGYDRYGSVPPPSPGRVPVAGPGSPGLHPAHAGPGGRPVSHIDPGSGGRASAPPAGPNGRPGPGPGSTASSPAPAAAGQQRPPPGGRPGAASSTNLVHPDGKTMGHGPATFEEMGIPQGKSEGDCVVM